VLDHAIDFDAARLIHFVAGHDSRDNTFGHDGLGT
jgi:hypothetical protein